MRILAEQIVLKALVKAGLRWWQTTQRQENKQIRGLIYAQNNGKYEIIMGKMLYA